MTHELSELLHLYLSPYLTEGEDFLLKLDGWQWLKGSPLDQTQYPAHQVTWQGERLGVFWSNDKHDELAHALVPVLSPLVAMERDQARQLWSYFSWLLGWLDQASEQAPGLCDWIGVYFHAPLLDPQASREDLLVAPYRGEVTEHVRIPIANGLCGLAFRERRLVNMADVHSDPRHIACSLKTRSELIVPLYNEQGEMIAELDIDSYTPDAFQPEVEARLVEYAKTFRFPLEGLFKKGLNKA